MYDYLAELFVYSITAAYLVLFILLIQYWARGMMRSRRKAVRPRPAGSADPLPESGGRKEAKA